MEAGGQMRFRQRGGKEVNSRALFFVLYCFISFTNTQDLMYHQLSLSRQRVVGLLPAIADVCLYLASKTLGTVYVDDIQNRF